MTKRRALISVSDKTGVVDFARRLTELGFEIISTGGTEKELRKAGLKPINISDITGFPECLDGRVKTLHPAVHAGLLARRDLPEHMEQLEKLGIEKIDVVAVNLYPFKATIEKPGVTLAEAVENIDIGGPTMIRSAAKNYPGVIVVVDPADYDEVIERIASDTADTDFRFRLSYKVFRHTSVYDTMIANYMQSRLGIEFPDQLTLAFEKKQDMRYGENPHQRGAWYSELFAKDTAGTLSSAVQLQGKELSYNNINDCGGALDLLKEFPKKPAVVAVKHANPCGVALGKNICEAYKKAYACDPVSIFGGIVACNREVDEETANEMVKIFLEIIIAPKFSEGAKRVLSAKKNLRLREIAGIDKPYSPDVRDMKKVAGGLLVQNKDTSLYSDETKVVTEAQPTKAQLAQLEFAYKVVKHTKSNAIVLAKNFMAIGIGAGQTNRIWAAEQAIAHAKSAGNRPRGAVLASDAFFPFDDCVKAAAKAGIKAIVQPGGSIRDEDSIKACNEKGVSMMFVGMRHFKH